MILNVRHTLWTGISETNVNIITSATRTHAFIIFVQETSLYVRASAHFFANYVDARFLSSFLMTSCQQDIGPT